MEVVAAPADSQRFERRGNLHALGFDKVKKFSWRLAIDLRPAVWIDGLQVVDSILDVVGLVRRLPRLFKEIPGRFLERGDRGLIARLRFLESCELVFDCLSLTRFGARRLAKRARLFSGLCPARHKIDGPGTIGVHSVSELDGKVLEVLERKR